ncbi:hypothetical protein [Pseudoalteromonas piscicida]|uniref:hypothetical protein n=1 Tax=Pseudoalteromonas piscicida TaxID=43662 RepID=UPI0012468DFF|nr:hypothetical protein [Pseudoalteromonas piscicida]
MSRLFYDFMLRLFYAFMSRFFLWAYVTVFFIVNNLSPLLVFYRGINPLLQVWRSSDFRSRLFYAFMSRFFLWAYVTVFFYREDLGGAVVGLLSRDKPAATSLV